MFPAMNVRRPISAGAIANREVHDSQVQFGGAKNQIEIAERVEVAETGAVARDRFIIFAK